MFNMPVMLSFWGKEENKNAVIESMARHGFKLNSKPTGTHATILSCLPPDGKTSDIYPCSAHVVAVVSIHIVIVINFTVYFVCVSACVGFQVRMRNHIKVKVLGHRHLKRV